MGRRTIGGVKTLDTVLDLQELLQEQQEAVSRTQGLLFFAIAEHKRQIEKALLSKDPYFKAQAEREAEEWLQHYQPEQASESDIRRAA